MKRDDENPLSPSGGEMPRAGNEQVPRPSALVQYGWRVAMVLVCCIYVGILASNASGLYVIGVATYGHWFDDLFAILASNDAVAFGIDPYSPNPLDYFHRSHVYTSWWLCLHDLGLTRADTRWLGLTLVTAFFAVAIAGLKPKSWKETVFYVAALCSSPVLLAANRANNDLVVFLILSAAPLCLVDSQRTVRLFAVFLIVFAAGLKFFPLAGALILLAAGDRGELRMRFVIFALLCGLAGISLAGDFARGSYYLPDVRGLFSFGSVAIPNALQISSRGWRLAGWALGIAAFLVFFKRSKPVPGEKADENEDRLRFIMGASLLCACFWLNMNFSYRLIFSLWMLPYLWRVPGDKSEGAGLRRLAAWTRVLLVCALWLDTCICLLVNLVVNRIPGANPRAWADRLYVAEQPVTWAFFLCLLAFLAHFMRERLPILMPAKPIESPESGSSQTRP
ncbi:MAG: glycosyltransferase 87 family protein [Opitutaceae bacterium]|jgi:hypothetical protein